MARAKAQPEQRVIVGRTVWHLPDDGGDLAATRCRIHGKQLQLTEPFAHAAGKPFCSRCARIALRPWNELLRDLVLRG